MPEASQFDIFILAAIISMISAAISMLKNCGYLDSSIQKRIAKPGWLMRFRLGRLARKHIADAKLADAVAVALPVAVSELETCHFKSIYEVG